MKISSRMISSAVAGLVVLWIGWLIVKASWLTPRNAMLQEISDLEDTIAQRNDALARAPRIKRELSQAAERTLAGDLQAVDHRFRTRLNRITEEIGLQSATVGTGGTAAKQSPARRMFSRRGAQRAYHDETDFVELDGWVNARGTLAQVLELIDRIEAEPWLKRIESVSLTPRENGERFDVGLRLRTLFLPGRGPAETPQGTYDGSGLGRLAALISRNPFQLAPEPPPTAPPAPPVVAETPPAPQFPYGQWKLTGVAEGPDGAEIWLNSRSNESRRLAVGDRIGDATLIAIDGEFATFDINEVHFRIQVGATLRDREPVDI